MDRGERSRQHRVMTEEPMPPLGVRLTVDVQTREGARGTTYYARVRWTHPVKHHREGVKRTHGSLEEARAWSSDWRVPREPVSTLVSTRRLCRPVGRSVGSRHRSHVDAGSQFGGLRKRVLPALGHLPVSMMAAGLIDRAIDQWEAAYGRSTVKNTIAARVLVLDEAVRDGLLVRNLGEGSGSAGVSSAGLRRLAGREHVEPAGRGSRAEGWLSGPG
jgi:hypothetical protein